MRKSITITVFLAALLSIPVMGAPAKTLFVGSFVGNNSSCTSPGYTSVQAAVTAAPAGSTVYLCSLGSPYGGPVVIHKSLTLTGDAGAAIQAGLSAVDVSLLPPQFTTDNLHAPMAVVVVWGASANVTISNITVSGPFTVTTGCAANLF